jgi:hypothetical protein
LMRRRISGRSRTWKSWSQRSEAGKYPPVGSAGKVAAESIYKDNADTIIGNMDSQIFLGGSEKTTLKDLTETLGKKPLICTTPVSPEDPSRATT